MAGVRNSVHQHFSDFAIGFPYHEGRSLSQPFCQIQVRENREAQGSLSEIGSSRAQAEFGVDCRLHGSYPETEPTVQKR
jgi:hypothetical protein